MNAVMWIAPNPTPNKWYQSSIWEVTVLCALNVGEAEDFIRWHLGVWIGAKEAPGRGLSNALRIASFRQAV